MKFFTSILLISVILATTMIVPIACEENTTETLRHNIQHSIIFAPNRNPPPCPKGQRKYQGECRQLV